MIINPEYLSKSGTEHGEQSALFCWANMARLKGFEIAWDMTAYGIPMQIDWDNLPAPELEWMYAVPNGGGRTAAQGAQLKAEGVKSGVADIFLPVGRFGHSKTHYGFYIEMKKEMGVPSDVSESQIQFARFVIRQQYAWAVAFGWQEAARLIQAYLCGTHIAPTNKQAKVILRIVEGI